MLSQDAYFGIELLMHSKKFLLAALAEFFVVRAAHAGEHASRAGPHRTATGPGGGGGREGGGGITGGCRAAVSSPATSNLHESPNTDNCANSPGKAPAVHRIYNPCTQSWHISR